MTALYLLANEYRDAAQRLVDLDMDDQTIADTLDGMSGELTVKAQNVGFMIRSLEADASAIKDWAKDAGERAKALEHRAESLRGYLQRCMEATGIEKIEGPGIVLSFRKSSAVAINEPDLIPLEFMRTPEPPPAAPDKKAIADALKAGREVPGAHLEHRRSLQVK
jgi:hypothetical protein